MMIKKIMSILLSFVVFFSIPFTAYAENSDAFKVYQNAVQATVGPGSWMEVLEMEADMTIQKGNAKTKTKVTLNSSMDISDYSENDLPNLKISGFTDMKVMGQTYSWNVVYENGVAHYKYTKPNKTTADIKIDPICFNFDTLTEDMLKNAKVSGNKITFTIPGDKMEATGIAAVNLMPGIENLSYGDVTVDITTDQSTGAIDYMTMIFHASLTYQGYDAEVDYTIDYQFFHHSNNTSNQESGHSEEFEMKDGMYIYSDYTNLSVPKNSLITLGAEIIIDGKQVEDTSGITFWIKDPSIIESVSTEDKNNFRYVKLKGLSEGLTVIGFSDSKTGYKAEVPVTVYSNNRLSYTLDSVPEKYIYDKYPTNIYNANGLYIDNYKFEINDNKSANVSFDVYNTNFTYGIVEVFNADGTLQGAVLINKMKLSNTSIKASVVDNIGYLVRDLVEQDFLTYRQETGHSVHTHVPVTVPKDGYIKITNDPEDSLLVNIVNSADILMSLGEVASNVKNYDVNAKVFAEKLTSKLVSEKAFRTLLEDGSDLPEKLWKGVAKDIFFSPQSLGDFSETVAKNIDELDLGQVITDIAVDFGWDMGEEVFKYFTGPIKKVFDGIFAFGKLTNIITQHHDLINSSNAGSIYIQNQGGGIRASQKITVESKNSFPESTSLNVFKLSLDPKLLELIEDINPELYEALKKGTTYTYNISLLDDGKEIQPSGTVTVHIPIPEKLKWFTYTGRTKIFRIGQDGECTEMDVNIENGCYVFETDHFSIYTIVGSNSFLTLEFFVLIGIVMAISIMLVLAIVFILKRRKNKK